MHRKSVNHARTTTTSRTDEDCGPRPPSDAHTVHPLLPASPAVIAKGRKHVGLWRMTASRDRSKLRSLSVTAPKLWAKGGRCPRMTNSIKARAAADSISAASVIKQWRPTWGCVGGHIRTLGLKIRRLTVHTYNRPAHIHLGRRAAVGDQSRVDRSGKRGFKESDLVGRATGQHGSTEILKADGRAVGAGQKH
jgi:hypothetical protein